MIATLWSQFQYFTGQTQVSLESASSALELISPGEEYIASFSLLFLALSNQAIGNKNEALIVLQQALIDHSLHRKQRCSLALCPGMCLSGCR